MSIKTVLDVVFARNEDEFDAALEAYQMTTTNDPLEDEIVMRYYKEPREYLYWLPALAAYIEPEK